jgi:hypothetical protein
MMTSRKCHKYQLVGDILKQRGLIELIHVVVSFVNCVHCLLQVISFCMFFKREFAIGKCCCRYFMDLLVYIS